MILTRSVPRVAPSTVRRPRLERWLSTHVAVPLRLLIAPAGSGKSTLLLKYFPHSAIDAAYCALPPECPTGELFQAMADALALQRVPASYNDLLTILRYAVVRPTELAVDDADNGSSETIDLLRKLVEDAPEPLSLIYTCRSREALDAKNWIARGLAVLCDHRRLAFDGTEMEMLAEACGVPASHPELARLLEESDGWAVVASGVIRAAAEDGRSLHGAYEHWRARYGQFFTEFIAADLDRASEEDRALIRSLIAGATIDDPGRLQQLEAQGLFVIAEGGAWRPYRALRQLHGRVRLAPGASLSPLVVRMFGRFETSIESQEVRWIRRRDRQILKYLALKPNGAATRSELAAAFWPDTDRQLAAQSVRTACSNIRKAIAAIVGYACVDRYFRADPDVSLDLANVVADVRRFTAHAEDGDACFERGEVQEAAAHYRAAEELYAGRLLDGDAPEAWFAVQAQIFEDRYVMLLERLAQAAFDEGDMKSASQFAYRVQQLRCDATGLVKMLGGLAPQYRTGPASLDDRRRKRAEA
jgi:hypothetical protein